MQVLHPSVLHTTLEQDHHAPASHILFLILRLRFLAPTAHTCSSAVRTCAVLYTCAATWHHPTAHPPVGALPLPQHPCVSFCRYRCYMYGYAYTCHLLCRTCLPRTCLLRLLPRACILAPYAGLGLPHFHTLHLITPAFAPDLLRRCTAQPAPPPRLPAACHHFCVMPPFSPAARLLPRQHLRRYLLYHLSRYDAYTCYGLPSRATMPVLHLPVHCPAFPACPRYACVLTRHGSFRLVCLYRTAAAHACQHTVHCCARGCRCARTLRRTAPH